MPVASFNLEDLDLLPEGPGSLADAEILIGIGTARGRHCLPALGQRPTQPRRSPPTELGRRLLGTKCAGYARGEDRVGRRARVGGRAQSGHALPLPIRRASRGTPLNCCANSLAAVNGRSPLVPETAACPRVAAGAFLHPGGRRCSTHPGQPALTRAPRVSRGAQIDAE
jgi:hypothetical protein